MLLLLVELSTEQPPTTSSIGYLDEFRRQHSSDQLIPITLSSDGVVVVAAAGSDGGFTIVITEWYQASDSRLSV
jgi:hypothetical protein